MAFTRRALQAGAILGTALTVALTGASTGVFGQSAPSSPPTRFFGNISGGQTGAVVKAMNGNTTCGTATGSGLYNGNSNYPNIYYVDVDTTQPGCGSGSTLTFTVNGVNASPTATVPDLPGQAVRVDLTTTGGTAPAAGTVSYTAGWNLVGVSAGTVLSQAANPLYTYPSGASDYTQVSNTTALQPGIGYWAYFAAPTTVTLSGSASLPATVNDSAGGYVMIGNPSPTKTVTVTGADVVYTYNAATGYAAATTLAPGQGAWAYCANPCTVTMQ